MLEREADRVAEQVTSGRPRRPALASPIVLQRATTRATDRLENAPASVRSVVSAQGRPLDSRTRSVFERRMGHDLSHVRIHDDQAAHKSTKPVNALAYTLGSHIVFSKGRYAPAQPAGSRLLAHELVHVLQQTGSAGRQPVSSSPPIQFKRSRGPGGCGWTATLNDFSGLGGLAHIQIQRSLTGYRSEVPVPRASKAGLLNGALACQPVSTPQGYADLARRKGTIFGFSEIKSLPAAKSGVAIAEAGHYVLRATQSKGRLLKTGQCSKYRADAVDYGFAAILGGVTASTGFGFLTGVISGDRSFGPYLGNPKQVLRAKEVMPGAIGYWCVSAAYERRRKRKEAREKRKVEKQKAKKEGKKPEKPKEKPKAKPKAQKPKAGGKAGAANVGFGISIFSTSVGGANVGVGVSIGSNSAAVGTVGAGISWFSDSAAAGAAGAGVSSDSESAAFGVVGVGQSADTVAAAAAAAGAGSTKGSNVAGAGVAGTGEMEGSNVAGAGTAGSSKQKDVTGATAGSTKKAQEGQKPGGKDTEIPAEAKEGQGEEEEESDGTQASEAKGQKGAGGEGKSGSGQKGAGGEGKSGSGHKSTSKESSGTGEGGRGQTPTGGPGTEPGAGAKPVGGKDGAGEGGDTAVAATQQTELGILANLPPDATEADRERAAVELAKVAAQLENASEAQKALLKEIANGSPDSQYLVPASDWIDKLMKATDGITSEDIEYLKTLNWKPGKISAEELRKRVLEALKRKKPPSDQEGGESAEAKDSKGGDKGKKSSAKGKGKAGEGGSTKESAGKKGTSGKGDVAVDPPAGSKRAVKGFFPFKILSGMSHSGSYTPGKSYPCTVRITDQGRTFELSGVEITFVSRTDEAVTIQGTDFTLPKFRIYFTKDFWSEKYKFYGRGGPDDTVEYEWGRLKKGKK